MSLIACYIDVFSHCKYTDDSKCTRIKIDFFFSIAKNLWGVGGEQVNFSVAWS